MSTQTVTTVHLVDDDGAAAYLDDRTMVREFAGAGSMTMSPLVADVIARHIRAGRSDSEIADLIGLSPRGVMRYRSRFGIATGAASQPDWTTVTVDRLRLALEAAAVGHDVELVLGRLLRGEAPAVDVCAAVTA